MKIYLLFIFFVSLLPLKGITQTLPADSLHRWTIGADHSIQSIVKDKGYLPYQDHIEMAGRKVAGIISYRIDGQKRLSIKRLIIFPQLRTYPKITDPGWMIYRAYLQDTYSDDILPAILIGNKKFVPGIVDEIGIKGMLRFTHKAEQGLSLVRTLYPSMQDRLFIEQWTLTNSTSQSIKISSGNNSIIQKEYGLKGKYTRSVYSDCKTEVDIMPGTSYTFSVFMGAGLDDEKLPLQASVNSMDSRRKFLDQISGSMNLETPDSVLNTLFEFSKIRASESIFDSKLGLMHSPGGGRYYCGIWANDQAEYAGPFFPFLGYQTGNEAALNAYRLFAKEMNTEYKNIRYSIEVEGDAPASKLDRGDAAMIAFGASQFVMFSGDSNIAQELWPLIEWCLEYCNRKINAEGVISSKSDEMEGRIETGTANLATSSLTYGALVLATNLAKDLQKPVSVSEEYTRRSIALKNAIETYFGANVEGLATYKYYKDHHFLRHWICLPLVVGINNRKEGTIAALFDRLWSDNGVHVENNTDNPKISEIFWDRGTLYALRGTFLAGATEQSLEKLTAFSKKRLLGNHVPYVVEAYPEGDMAHLSAESALYCRVFTEGMFGIRPTGLKSFTCVPRLPVTWDRMALKNLHAFGTNFNIIVTRIKQKLLVEVTDAKGKVIYKKAISPNEHCSVRFL